MGFTIDFSVLNQKGTPALYSDIFANRPAAGYQGRLFIATDTAAIYEDTGTAWTLIANVSSGAGTLQQVTTNGNTSNVGISVTAGGVSTNSLTDTSLTTGSVPFAGAGGLISQDNANLFWDDTNNRLGINTNTPGNILDVHTAGTNPTIAINNTAGNRSAISFLNSSVAKWRIGNTSNNDFEVFNTTIGILATSISLSNVFTIRGSLKLFQGAGFTPEAGYTSIGADANGVVFQTGTSVNNAFFIFTGLTAPRGFTFPDAAGTVALTSNLSSYLPLAGGTLTGALGGTSAVFSSTVQGSAYYLAGMTAGAGALYWVSDRVTLANYNASGLVTIETNGGAITATFGGATYNNDFVGTGRFTGALNGTSATFTGSVTAKNGSSGIAFTTTNAVDADFTVETVSGGTTKIGTSGNTLAINSGGGNVLINSTTDDTVNKLQVNGSAKIEGATYRYNGQTLVGGSSTNLVAIDVSSSRTYLIQMIPTDVSAALSYRIFGVIQVNAASGTYIFNSIVSQTMNISFSGSTVQAIVTNGQQWTFNWTITQLL
jgi:hypothetical protein